MSEDSPFDRFDGSGIEAFVVDRREAEPRVRGFALGGDLAAHYSFSEVLGVVMTDDFRSTVKQRALDVALVAAMDVSIADGASHATRLARKLGSAAGNEGSAVTVAAIGASEMTRHEVEGQRPLLQWLVSDQSEPLPPEAQGVCGDPFVASLQGCVSVDELGLTRFFAQSPSAIATVLALLWSSGLTSEFQISATLTTARILVLTAEAFAAPDPDLWSYPLNLPFWEYERG